MPFKPKGIFGTVLGLLLWCDGSKSTANGRSSCASEDIDEASENAD